MKFIYGNHKWIDKYKTTNNDRFEAYDCDLCGLNYDIEYRSNGKDIAEEFWRINHSTNWKYGKPPKTCEEVRMIEALE